jgi:hypothetical protein
MHHPLDRQRLSREIKHREAGQDLLGYLTEFSLSDAKFHLPSIPIPNW